MLGVVSISGSGGAVTRTSALARKKLTGTARDVAAGIAILQEAGGLVTTANPPAEPERAAIPGVRLGSRLYLAVR